eukprot:1158926-Pelagomonas_calceolata.AAC.3
MAIQLMPSDRLCSSIRLAVHEQAALLGQGLQQWNFLRLGGPICKPGMKRCNNTRASADYPEN